MSIPSPFVAVTGVRFQPATEDSTTCSVASFGLRRRLRRIVGKFLRFRSALLLQKRADGRVPPGAPGQGVMTTACEVKAGAGEVAEPVPSIVACCRGRLLLLRLASKLGVYVAHAVCVAVDSREVESSQRQGRDGLSRPRAGARWCWCWCTSSSKSATALTRWHMHVANTVHLWRSSR